MNKKVLGIILLALSFSVIVQAEEEAGVKVNGVSFNIASDRRIIKVGGVYQPEELDFYMKRRFDDIQTQLAQIQESQKKLEERIQTIEISLPKTQQVEIIKQT